MRPTVPLRAATAPDDRAAVLQAAADRLEEDFARCMDILMREAGKSAANAIAEVREAMAIFCATTHAR